MNRDGQQAIATLLEELGPISGFALGVYDNEKLPDDARMLGLFVYHTVHSILDYVYKSAGFPDDPRSQELVEA